MRQRDNLVLARLVTADQRDRQNYVGNEERVAKRDAQRRKRVLDLIKQKKIQTARDYFNAALVFQHGMDLRDYELARDFSRLAMEKGEEEGKWLYAAATDRWLIAQGKKQKYGTQYYTHTSFTRTGKKVNFIKISPYDRRTTDQVRKKFNLPSLRQLIAKEKIYTKQFFGGKSRER